MQKSLLLLLTAAFLHMTPFYGTATLDPSQHYKLKLAKGSRVKQVTYDAFVEKLSEKGYVQNGWFLVPGELPKGEKPPFKINGETKKSEFFPEIESFFTELSKYQTVTALDKKGPGDSNESMEDEAPLSELKNKLGQEVPYIITIDQLQPPKKEEYHIALNKGSLGDDEYDNIKAKIRIKNLMHNDDPFDDSHDDLLIVEVDSLDNAETKTKQQVIQDIQRFLLDKLGLSSLTIDLKKEDSENEIINDDTVMEGFKDKKNEKVPYVLSFEGIQYKAYYAFKLHKNEKMYQKSFDTLKKTWKDKGILSSGENYLLLHKDFIDSATIQNFSSKVSEYLSTEQKGTLTGWYRRVVSLNISLGLNGTKSELLLPAVKQGLLFDPTDPEVSMGKDVSNFHLTIEGLNTKVDKLLVTFYLSVLLAVTGGPIYYIYGEDIKKYFYGQDEEDDESIESLDDEEDDYVDDEEDDYVDDEEETETALLPEAADTRKN